MGGRCEGAWGGVCVGERGVVVLHYLHIYIYIFTLNKSLKNLMKSFKILQQSYKTKQNLTKSDRMP